MPHTDLISSFFEAAGKYRTSTAIFDNDIAVTYAELADQVSFVADRVRALPGGPERPVGLLESFNSRSVAAALGIMAAGRCYCPIDPVMAGARLSAFLEAADLQDVVHVAPPVPALPGTTPLVLDLTSVPKTDPPERAPSLDQPAYLLFTSGSTGKPKGAQLAHRTLATTVPELTECYGIGGDDRVLHFTPLFWDTSLEELLPPLTRGGAVVMDGNADVDLDVVIEERGITVLNLPTAFWNEFVGYLVDQDIPLPAPLRTVIIGGEPVRWDMLQRWRRLKGSERVRLLNTYGATETGMVTHSIDLTGLAARPDPAGPVPIGHPMPYVDQKIIDDRGRPVTEAGAEGELCVAGDSIAIRYYRQPELTAERFFESDLGSGRRRYFRTRDRVRIGASGALEFAGRIDQVVKIRGIRIDLEEAEFWIGSHPGVRAVVVVQQSKGEHNTLVALVLPRPDADQETLPQEIHAYLRANVPPYLVPTTVKVVPEFVHTRSRKIDRNATRDRYLNGPR